MSLSFFKKNKPIPFSSFKVDIHSHLIFGVDDGVQTLEESIELISRFKALGYQKLVTTPHIMGDYYKNSRENLLPILDVLKNEIQKQNIGIEIDCAAEYYLDEFFVGLIKNKANLMSFGDCYLLLETGFMNEPIQLNEVIFDLLSNGYRPVLAHPERYLYFHQGGLEKYKEVKEKGILFQLNLNSLNGYYSKPVKHVAEMLLTEGLYDFVGSDCHNNKHMDHMQKEVQEKISKLLNKGNFLNSTLL